RVVAEAAAEALAQLKQREPEVEARLRPLRQGGRGVDVALLAARDAEVVAELLLGGAGVARLERRAGLVDIGGVAREQLVEGGAVAGVRGQRQPGQQQRQRARADPLEPAARARAGLARAAVALGAGDRGRVQARGLRALLERAPAARAHLRDQRLERE